MTRQAEPFKFQNLVLYINYNLIFYENHLVCWRRKRRISRFSEFEYHDYISIWLDVGLVCFLCQWNTFDAFWNGSYFYLVWIFLLVTWNNQETLKCVVEPVKDTIKRVMMKDTEEKQFGSMISCGRHLIKTYGFMRLFRGNFNSNYPNMTQHNLEWPKINNFIQVQLVIFYDSGHQVSRLLWTTCCKM